MHLLVSEAGQKAQAVFPHTLLLKWASAPVVEEAPVVKGPRKAAELDVLQGWLVQGGGWLVGARHTKYLGDMGENEVDWVTGKHVMSSARNVRTVRLPGLPAHRSAGMRNCNCRELVFVP